MDFTVKQIAELTGVTADTLRYYDKEGIVSPKRHENGYRYYDEKDVKALKYLVVLKYAQFSLAEVRSMVWNCSTTSRAQSATRFAGA